METKEIKITPPEGFEIDKENSTFECIKFKPIKKERWRYDINASIQGYFINIDSEIIKSSRYANYHKNYNIFATEKQAKSALAMARISQIIANDERFGGPITNEEWLNNSIIKYSLDRVGKYIFKSINTHTYNFLAFHTQKQRDLFLEENEDLVRDYLML